MFKLFRAFAKAGLRAAMRHVFRLLFIILLLIIGLPILASVIYHNVEAAQAMPLWAWVIGAFILGIVLTGVAIKSWLSSIKRRVMNPFSGGRRGPMNYPNMRPGRPRGFSY